MDRKINKQLFKFLNIFGPFIGLIFVYALFAVYAREEGFASTYNTKLILTQAVIFGIGALGMTLIIISGGIDLSAGSVVALGTVVVALVLRVFGGGPEATVSAGLAFAAVLVGLSACAYCGFLNGVMISGIGLSAGFVLAYGSVIGILLLIMCDYLDPRGGFWIGLAAVQALIVVCMSRGFLTRKLIAGPRIVPFIVTLGMMQIVRGVALGLADQTTVNTPKNWLTSLMVVEPTSGAWYSVAPGVWVMLLLAVVMFVLLQYTVFGRHIFAVGSNEATARLCGIDVPAQCTWIYTVSGLLVGVASVMQFSNLSLGDPTAAKAMELDIIAAVVIGGGSLSGGEGSIVGSLVGALIMAVLRNGCNMVGVDNWVQNIVIGAIIITAVGIDRLKHARRV